MRAVSEHMRRAERGTLRVLVVFLLCVVAFAFAEVWQREQEHAAKVGAALAAEEERP